jgi:membrane protein implicated in regulation of membrane protease activity
MALVVGILLAVFVLPGPWDLAAIAGGAAIEVGEAAYWWRWTHRRRPVVGAEALIGRGGRVVDACRPDGKIRVDGELWSARCTNGADAGEPVLVVAIEGLTLVVERR